MYTTIMSPESGCDPPTGEPAWMQAERDYRDELRERGTIPELFEESARRRLDSRAQLYKGGVYERSVRLPEPPDGEYGAVTYGELREIVRSLAAGFRHVGFEGGDRVGIFASTRMEWTQSDLALLAAGCTVTTVYADSSRDQVRYLLGDPEATGVIVENETLLDRLLDVEDELDVSVIVLIDEPDTAYERDDIYTLGEIRELGQAVYEYEQYQAWLSETDPDDPASLIYTSGTTGKPKGVRLTHWNFRSNIHQIRRRVGPRPEDPDRFAIDRDLVTISFLPLAHVFERLVGQFLMLGSGATVGYAESSDTVAEDLKKIRPHTGASVPRVYERIFDNMRSQAGDSSIEAVGSLKERIFEWSLDVARTYQSVDDPGRWLRVKHGLANRLVYSTIKQELGGRIKFMISGGGRLSERLTQLFVGMGIPILEGYGLTETAPVVSVNSPDDIRPGTLGPPLVGVDVALDVSQAPDRELSGPDSELGELLVRGDNVTDGYWRTPGATDRAFVTDPDTVPSGQTDATRGEDGDGQAETTENSDRTPSNGDTRWFKTGDLVEQTGDGYLIFHERIKQLLVLSTGKNVAPGPIEDAFATNERITQAMVVGDGRKFVGALIVPNFERLEQWAELNGYDLPADRDSLCEHERAHEWVQVAVDTVNEGLERVERIKQFELLPAEWSSENDMLTPSMKKKRRNIKRTYNEKIAAIYDE